MNRILCLLFTAVLCGAAEPTSKSNENLQRILKRYPAADANQDGILTHTEAKAFQKLRSNREANRPVLKPTNADIAYGTHARHKLDLWLVRNDRPTPLLICIHGGGFRAGDKSSYHRQVNLIKRMHAAGISVAAINYRFTEGGNNPLPGAMHDSGRALQFLRHHAKKYNLDKTRFAATGGSAGACILMWLGFHNDLADPDNADPVKRESTRLIALAPSGGQPTLSPVTFRKWFGVKNLIPHPAMRAIFGLRGEGDIEWTPQLTERARINSPITYLTRDDPPCYQTYGSADSPVTEKTNPNQWVHHPRLGIELKEAMDQLGIECHVQYKGGPPIKAYRGVNDFLVKKLTGK
ncbi:MAG: alpha/beta hydrolase [Verrucomicrobia subdivision 3 bacterium]|nr:alpha/beta hydrolase [Limisphaerales bacterium]